MAFWSAFVAGLCVVWLFAGDQFNRRSWKVERRLARMLSVLNPADLRGSRVLQRAFLVYVTLLTTLYAVFVYLVAIGVIAWESGQSAAPPGDMAGGLLPGDGQSLKPPQPWVPLAISLAMVGLAPRLPILQRIEEKLREKAHELMGIPVELLSAGEDIAGVELTLEQIGPEYVADADAARIARMVAAAREVLGEKAKVDRLERALLKLVAFKAWVLEGDWPSKNTREPYEKLEQDLEGDIQALFDDLADVAAASQPGAADATLIKRWEGRIEAARDLCAEICSLMFIYSEKEDPATRAGRASGNGHIAPFFERVRRKKNASPDLDILLNSLAAAVLLAAIWGYGVAMLGPQFGVLTPHNPAANSLIVALSAFFVYGPAMLAALWWQGQSAHGEPQAAAGHGFSIRRNLAVFAVCFVVSLLVLAPFNATQAMMSAGLPTQEKVFKLLQYSITLEAPMAVLGGLQGVFVARYLALWRQDRSGWSIVLLNGLVLMLWAAYATQLIVPQYGRAPELADFLLRAPIAGLIGWTSGAVMVSALVSDRRARDAHADVPG